MLETMRGLMLRSHPALEKKIPIEYLMTQLSRYGFAFSQEQVEGMLLWWINWKPGKDIEVKHIEQHFGPRGG